MIMKDEFEKLIDLIWGIFWPKYQHIIYVYTVYFDFTCLSGFLFLLLLLE